MAVNSKYTCRAKMSTLENLKEILNDYRNSVKSDLDNEELKEVDKYIKKVIDDVAPVLAITAELSNNQEELKEMKKYLDNIIQEEEWLEKLLKTS